MKMLAFFVALYLAHRFMLSLSPAYRVRMQRFDRKITWLNIMLVTYLAISFMFKLVRHFVF
jgi:hypothetical protein